MFLVVAESSGSSPGRAGYKMAVTADGELCGSIGGGVMEVNLVERSREILSGPPDCPARPFLIDQVHRTNSPDASGMICSGYQSVILKVLTPEEIVHVSRAVSDLSSGLSPILVVADNMFAIAFPECPAERRYFERKSKSRFSFSEFLGPADHVHIIGGGHCALALSELMAKLDFRVSIFDDRPELNTIAKNEFADEVTIIDDYETIADHIPENQSAYTVVMTLGYASDKVAIKQLYDRDFKYFGVLGSKSKMATLMKELREEGVPDEQLTRIRTPIGIPINSRTPEEIAVSIAAEIIAVKNEAEVTSPRSRRAIRSK